MSNHSLSLILPAFNEAKNLSATVEDALSSLVNVVPELEILIVDDGSIDATAEVSEYLASRHPLVRIIRHPHNRGYGATLRSGFAAARYDLVFFTDSDGQFRFDQVGDFIKQIDAFDMVIGFRANRQDRWWRKANSRIGNWLARTLLGVRVKDINCAYKMFHRLLLQQLSLTSEGAMISTELLAFAAQAGWTFQEVAVAHYPRKFGSATGARFLVIIRTFVEYFQLRHRIAGLRRQ
jgi:glycosyltransferase involved in cell wall biosynthesis